MSSVNVAEVVSTLQRKGLSLSAAINVLRLFQLPVESFDEAQALAVAALWPATKPYGLSLGDRACLVLAQRLNAPLLTADKVWGQLNLGIEIRVIR